MGDKGEEASGIIAKEKLLLQMSEHFEELDTIMSNFDHRIERNIAEQLKDGDYFAPYTAWNFCGYVWYERASERWNCEVWRYNAHVDTITAESLEGIMQETSERYGRD